MKLDDASNDLKRILELSEKTLHLTSVHSDEFGAKCGRPYYYLGRGWGITSLDTGQPFFVNTDDRNITPWLIMGGKWEPDVTRVLLDYIRPGMTAIDVGAHCGYYSVKIGDKVGSDGRMFVFEPNPDMARVCLANINLNGLRGRTHFYRAALFELCGTAVLNRSDENLGSSNILGDLNPDSTVEVETLTLDSLAEIDRPVDIIKLDAEGAEVPILKGATNLLARSPNCAIVMEWGQRFWERHASMLDVVNICGGAGRQLYVVQSDGTVQQMAVQNAITAVKSAEPNMLHVLVAKPEVVNRYISHLVSS